MSTLFGFLLLASALGLVIGLMKPSWLRMPSRVRVIINCGIAMIIFLVLAALTSPSASLPRVATSEPSNQQEPTITPPVPESLVNTPAPSQSAIVTPPIQERQQVSYEIVERWTIPNGGEGKVIVISPEFLNEKDMTALSEKLKNDTKNDRNAFIFVFDDKKAASLRSAVLSGKASEANSDFYDKHFVGQYSRNINTGYHEFSMYFDGVMGTNHKTLKY